MSPDAPTPPEDLITFRLGRRVLRRDVARLAALSDGLLAGTRHLETRRLAAFAAVVEQLCDELVGEQAFEEALLWPLLERFAPDVVAAADPAAEHPALRALFDDARRASRTVVRNLTARPAALATAADHRDVGALARAWAAVLHRLDAHFRATDPTVVAAVTAAVPRPEWAELLDEARRRLPDRRAATARVLEVATPEERARLDGRLSRSVAVRRGTSRRRRADDALLFGSDPEP